MLVDGAMTKWLFGGADRSRPPCGVCGKPSSMIRGVLSNNLLFLSCCFLLGTTVATPAFARQTAPKMMIEGTDIALSNVAANANLVASAVTDFGGYLFPVFGIASLAALILFLAPPLVDE